MLTLRQKVLWFAGISRIAIICAQILFNLLIPDHDADAFRSPRNPEESVGLGDKIVEVLFGGFERWDAQYFLHVAKYGYTHENTLAFFPLFPLLTRGCALLLFYFLQSVLNYHSVTVLSAVSINVFLFVVSAQALYSLSRMVLQDECLAYKSAIFYCVNPASIFFLAPYSETLYALLTFYGMQFYNRSALLSSVFFGLSSAARSNGIVNAGFVLYNAGKKLWNKKRLSILWSLSLLFSCSLLVICWGPFLLFQNYAYNLYCSTDSSEVLQPEFIRKFCDEKEFRTPGRYPSWCQNKIPTSYSYIQNHYWEVGFLKYYEWKQVPNFLLATPVIIIFSQIFLYLKRNWKLCLTIELNQVSSEVPSASRMFPFVIHGLWLLMVCILFVHIQVTTRLLASASPLLYWFAAQHTSPFTKVPLDESNKPISAVRVEPITNLDSKWKVFLWNGPAASKTSRFIFWYFLSYCTLGTVLFCNFYPWT